MRSPSPLRLAAALVVASLAAVALSSRAVAENQVTVRSSYFREPSTRVIQPVVEIEKDLPHGLGVRAHYLLDAITSASAAAGTGVDVIFTEFRNEGGLSLSWDVARTRLRASYKYSAESDYWSHTMSGSAAQRLWGDTLTVQGALGVSLDSVTSRSRTLGCAKAGEFSCSLRNIFGGVGVTQVLSPRFIAQGGYEVSVVDGFQANPYRTGPNVGYETLPSDRTRHAAALRLAYYLPGSRTGLQAHGRYYWDSWSIDSKMLEGRLYQALTSQLEARFTYRYYFQTPAGFWCDWMARPDCYGPTATVYAFDPKLENVSTSMPELKLMWHALALRDVTLLGWFAEGTFEISYGRLFQSTSFANAHLVQVGYSLPY